MRNNGEIISNFPETSSPEILGGDVRFGDKVYKLKPSDISYNTEGALIISFTEHPEFIGEEVVINLIIGRA